MLLKAAGGIILKKKGTFATLPKDRFIKSVNLLEISKRRRYLSDESHQVFYREAEEIAKMLSGLMNAISNDR